MTQVMKGVRGLEVAQFTYVPAAGAILATLACTAAAAHRCFMAR